MSPKCDLKKDSFGEVTQYFSVLKRISVQISYFSWPLEGVPPGSSSSSS